MSKKQLISLSEGTVVEGVHCTPDYVELLPKQPDILRARLRIVVSIVSVSPLSSGQYSCVWIHLFIG